MLGCFICVNWTGGPGRGEGSEPPPPGPESGTPLHCAPRRSREAKSVNQTLAIALGGAVGAVLRFWSSQGVYALLGRNFPYGTLAVNLLGSALMGLLYVLLVERLAPDGVWRAFFLVGLLGAYTTFSTFSMETLQLLMGGEMAKALSNVIASVILCLAGAWAGVLVGRSL